MKIVKALSLLIVLFTLSVIAFKLYVNLLPAPANSDKVLVEVTPLSTVTGDSLSNSSEEKALESPMDLRLLESLLSPDTSMTASPSITEAEKNNAALLLIQRLDEENKKLKAELDSQKNSEDKAVMTGTIDLSKSGTQMFLAKALFSFLFCISALYVVLSNKYDEDTTKWAFSVLSLIAGVWIGTMA